MIAVKVELMTRERPSDGVERQLTGKDPNRAVKDQLWQTPSP